MAAVTASDHAVEVEFHVGVGDEDERINDQQMRIWSTSRRTLHLMVYRGRRDEGLSNTKGSSSSPVVLPYAYYDRPYLMPTEFHGRKGHIPLKTGVKYRVLVEFWEISMATDTSTLRMASSVMRIHPSRGCKHFNRKGSDSEVVQLAHHVRRDAPVDPAARLAQAKDLQPGQSEKVNLTLGKHAASFWEERLDRWVVEKASRL
ncbi:hypothetical protein EV702DRAFT_1196234 [Suillus placidus]|uniref:Fibronectin type III-like domain-containing protein n=1 Tax=Suillus placidus TaxID=48579 RepID=A0A9P6ZY05_9AGAM|nr:hypothetical protein EV702DRAFT_1196234 [Suillus placidus]